MNLRCSSPFDLRCRALLLFLLASILFTPLMAAHAGQVSVAWDPNTEPDLAGYRVYYGISSGDYSTMVDVGNVTTTTIDGLEVGKTYYFAATAYDTEDLESNFSNEISYAVPGETTSHTISASAGSGGTISPSGQVPVNNGGNKKFSIEPDSGFHVLDVLVDGSSVGAVSSYTFSNLTGNHTISASFIDPNQDSDGDGIPDQWELAHGLDPDADDASEDPDGDGITNFYEYEGGTDPAQFDANQAPDAPVLVSPADDDLVSLVPTLQTAEFYDPDFGDTHSQTQWKIVRESDSRVVFQVRSRSALTEIIVPKLILESETDYSWQVLFYDNHGFASEWSQVSYFSTPVNTDDSDEDGVLDLQEIGLTVDLDNNGVYDLDQSDIKCVRAGSETAMVGVGITDSPSALEIMSVLWEDPLDLVSFPDQADKPDSMPFGLINFKILVEQPGDEVEITVHLSEPAPSDISWYKYDPVEGVWQDYSDNVFFSQDRKSVTLVLEDGGPGDVDGVANGIIVDPSGPGTVAASASSSESDDGGGLSLDSLASCFITSAAQDQAGRQQAALWQTMRGRELALLFVLAALVCARQAAVRRIR